MWWIWLASFVILLFLAVVFRGAPYVPSHKRDIEQAFTDIYRLKKSDFLVDIGSGDGVVLRAASKYGAKALGYEINPILVLISRLLSIKDSNVKTIWADFWLTNLPEQVTIVYTFGESRHINRMAFKVQAESNRLKKTIYLLSYGFDVKNNQHEKQIGAYFLYRFDPLQAGQAQV